MDGIEQAEPLGRRFVACPGHHIAVNSPEACWHSIGTKRCLRHRCHARAGREELDGLSDRERRVLLLGCVDERASSVASTSPAGMTTVGTSNVPTPSAP